MKLPKLLASFGFCFLIAALGSAVTLPAISGWYLQLHKPFFAPPNSVFGPVWTILYCLMAVALYLVWSYPNKVFHKEQALRIFGLQLLLNFSWSFVFFGLHAPLPAFLVIVGLWGSIFVTIARFKAISELAATLLLPYIAWVSFAAILNLAIVLLN
jgi:translocator protein